ncbi:MAG: KUP/HAK/KT family potassium transporter [Chthoniobacterales bacterium]|nr:KUP/HAK/KT family potassium transporter [Chthoniobacterales bacterium]
MFSADFREGDRVDPTSSNHAETISSLGQGGIRRLRVTPSLSEVLFFGANMLKILHGGWFPLLVSATILFFMLTWRKGRQALGQRMREITVPLATS